MIRINLLGQARPKAAKQAVPLEATVQVIFFSSRSASRRRPWHYLLPQTSQLDATNAKHPRSATEKASFSR